MRLTIVILTGLAVVGAVNAQRHKLESINAETPEGKVLHNLPLASLYPSSETRLA